MPKNALRKRATKPPSPPLFFFSHSFFSALDVRMEEKEQATGALEEMPLAPLRAGVQTQRPPSEQQSQLAEAKHHQAPPPQSSPPRKSTVGEPAGPPLSPSPTFDRMRSISGVSSPGAAATASAGATLGCGCCGNADDDENDGRFASSCCGSCCNGGAGGGGGATACCVRCAIRWSALKFRVAGTVSWLRHRDSRPESKNAGNTTQSFFLSSQIRIRIKHGKKQTVLAHSASVPDRG